MTTMRCEDAPTISCDAVTIRPQRREDLEPFGRFLDDPSVRRWFGEDGVEALAEDPDASDQIVLTIEHEGEVAGWLCLWEEDDAQIRHAGLDLMLGPGHQGRGIGTLALYLGGCWLLDARGHHRLTIDPSAANGNAIRAYRKLGFRDYGRTRQSTRTDDGRFEDTIMMELLAGELNDPRPGHGLHFRNAAPDRGDAAQLVSRMGAEIAAIYDGLDIDSPDMPKAGPAEFAAGNGGSFLLGSDDDGPVCCGGIKRLDDKHCEIKRMYVAERARGRGVARTLLRRLEQEARTLGYITTRLDTGPRQPAAEHLYRSTGYREIPNFNANPMATFFGEKRL